MSNLTDHRVFEGPLDFTIRDDAPSEDAVLALKRIGTGGPGDVLATFEDAEAEGRELVDVERRWVVHSPTGFEFGYGGSGPADLALNVLGHFLDAPTAYRIHQPFKWEFIARCPRDGGKIRVSSIREFIRRQGQMAPAS